MAWAVAEGVKGSGVDPQVKRADETTNADLLRADGILVGSPTYYGQMSSAGKAMFDASTKIHGELAGKVSAAFTSSGGVATGAETTILSIVKAMLIHGMIIQGRANSEHYGAAAVGAPKESDKQSCRELGKATVSLVQKLKP